MFWQMSILFWKSPCVMVVWAIRNSCLLRWILDWAGQRMWLSSARFVYLLHAMLFQDIVCEELLFVETNHRQALLMEVAVVMAGEGLLCVRVCLHLYLHPKPHSPELTPLCVSLTFDSITLSPWAASSLLCCLLSSCLTCWRHLLKHCTSLSLLMLRPFCL